MWGWLSGLIEFFKSVTAVAKVVEKAQPEPEERKEKLDIEKPLLEYKVNEEIADKIFKRVKNNPEADLLYEIRSLTNLPPAEETALFLSIEARLKNHRAEHPIISGMRRFEKNHRK